MTKTNTPNAYIVGKARGFMKRKGGNPEMAGPLAEWAQARWEANRAGEARVYDVSVIVSEDGTLMATTTPQRYRDGSLGAHYVDEVLVDDEVLRGRVGSGGIREYVADFAMSRIQHRTGLRCVIATFDDVCTGAADRSADAALTN